MDSPALPAIATEIREQPAILRRILARAVAEIGALVEPRRHRRVHFVGCGDMHFASEATAWLARPPSSAGVAIRAWRSMDLRWAATGIDGEDLVVCSSVSGRTPRTIEAALEALRHGARVVAITDNDRSPLVDVVGSRYLLETSPPDALAVGAYPGYHHQVAQTKTFTAALLAQILVAARASGRVLGELAALPTAVDATIDAFDAARDLVIARCFAGRARVEVLASGPYLPIARYGAAKFLEYAIPAHAQCLEEFNHLEIFVADESTLAIVLAPDDASRTRAAELLASWERVGLRAIVVGAGGDYPGASTAVFELMADVASGGASAQSFALAVALQEIAWRGARALGRDVDRWLGGVRTDLHNRVSRRTVRGETGRGEA